jgi:hypothetical protein
MAVTNQSWTAEGGWYDSRYEIGRTNDVTVSTAEGRRDSNGEYAGISKGEAVSSSSVAIEESHEDSVGNPAVWLTYVNVNVRQSCPCAQVMKHYATKTDGGVEV